MSYIIMKAHETGIPADDLEVAWNSSMSQQKSQTPEIPESDPMFTKKVMDRFDNQVNMIHVDKARSIVMAREAAVQNGQEWINALAQNNYVKASEHFPKFVNSSYESLVNSHSKEFMNKFSEKLRKNSSESK